MKELTTLTVFSTLKL